jgi:hypothetical protein
VLREVLRIGGYTQEFFILQTPELATMAVLVINLKTARRSASPFPPRYSLEPIR